MRLTRTPGPVGELVQYSHLTMATSTALTQAFQTSAKGGTLESADAAEVSDDALRTWLNWLGLRFDPFLPLDASTDPRLSDYLVGHETFATVWGDWVSFVFAPAGGGKTALRVHTTQACWVGQETNHPFPIPYLPPFLVWSHTRPSLDQHLAAISQAGAIRLLLALAHRPHWVFHLDGQSQQILHQTLDWNLPGPLDGYLHQCSESRSLSPLREAFDPTFVLPDFPDESTLLHLCDVLGSIAPNGSTRPSPRERWDKLVHLLLETLGFRAIYLLIDGLDAVPETATDAEAAVACVSTLLPEVAKWNDKRVFVKGYLPLETQPILTGQFPIVMAQAHTANIEWTPALLAEVVRRRVYAASEGTFGSLDAVASPALRDIETMLAKAVVPLPREMLVLTRRVLWEHVLRAGTIGTIQPEDVDAALGWYAANRPGAREVDTGVLIQQGESA